MTISERLISLADGTVGDVSARLADADIDETVGALLGEIACRAALFDPPPHPVTAQFDLGVAGHRVGYLVTLDADEKISAGWAADPWIRIRQDLAELLLAVYGSATRRHDSTREVFLKDTPGPASRDPDDPWLVERGHAKTAARQLVGGCSPHRWDLTTLAMRFGTDKWGGHWYTPHYERYFEPLRDQRMRILEIGIGGYADTTSGGASLRLWKHYFPRGLVYGLDVYDKQGVAEPRIHPMVGDQSDAGVLNRIGAQVGPFDIIIDDGSHITGDVITSFATLFPYLAPGGIYVIEDVQTSYWPGWGGNSDDLNDPNTSIGLVKSLIDGLNHAEIDVPGRQPTVTDVGVVGVHLHHNLAFIEKGRNTESSYPPWAPRHSNTMGRTD